MSKSELLALARDYDALTEDAQAALRAEFSARQLEPPLVEETSPEPSTNPDPLVTVRRYRDLSEAIVARTLIESAGIACTLQDENLVRLDWQVSNFIGGIRLQVPRSQAQASEDLLSEPIPEEISFNEAVPAFGQSRCPVCNSPDVQDCCPDRTLAIAMLFLFSLPAPQGAPSFLCNHCEATWFDPEDGG